MVLTHRNLTNSLINPGHVSTSTVAHLYIRLFPASKVVNALEEAKIPYKARSGGTISVPADKVHSLRIQLAGKGIPGGGTTGFSLFDKPNFGISDFVQRINYLRAIQGELSQTISRVDGIESAQVMLVMPENRLLVEYQKKPSASVFLKLRGNVPVSAATVNAIRFLVANAVEGLNPDGVSITDNIGNLLTEAFDNDPITGNLDVAQLEAAYVPGKTKAVMVAHTLGNPFDLAAVLRFCRRHDLWLVEDNCDALGSTYSMPKVMAKELGIEGNSPGIPDDGIHTTRYTGTWGDLSTQSFYPPHHLTMGEGGAVK